MKQKGFLSWKSAPTMLRALGAQLCKVKAWGTTSVQTLFQKSHRRMISAFISPNVWWDRICISRCTYFFFFLAFFWSANISHQPQVHGLYQSITENSTLSQEAGKTQEEFLSFIVELQGPKPRHWNTMWDGGGGLACTHSWGRDENKEPPSCQGHSRVFQVSSPTRVERKLADSGC